MFFFPYHKCKHGFSTILINPSIDLNKLYGDIKKNPEKK